MGAYMPVSGRAAEHLFHIPVMGTGFTADSAIRVGHLGIATVVSLVDDVLLERLRKYHSQKNNLPFEAVSPSLAEARSERIRRYMDLVQDLVDQKVQKLRDASFSDSQEKHRYFTLLPESSKVKQRYIQFLNCTSDSEKQIFESELNRYILPGSVDGNIMVKLDREPARLAEGLSPEYFTDAKAAMRGYAASKARGDLVLSAGINQPLIAAMEFFPAFYPDAQNPPAKGIVIKVSDFRSALIQGKYLARKGLKVREFRIESGLNCGGHAFATDGLLFGPVIQEFKDRRAEFSSLNSMITQGLAKKGYTCSPEWLEEAPLITAQGGIGNHGEIERFIDAYGLDRVGLASPFLLVPEVTGLDDATREQLRAAEECDLYLSGSSPLGVPFHNLRNSSSERQLLENANKNSPGSACPKGHICLNHEYGKPLCRASKEYQSNKLKEMGYSEAPSYTDAPAEVRKLYDKSCICHQLGNGVLIEYGLIAASNPVAVCPGPNLAYFNKICSLEQMLNHMYGRSSETLVPLNRPHTFAKELRLYVDHFREYVKSGIAQKNIEEYAKNLRDGIDHYRLLCTQKPFVGENLQSLEIELDKLEPVIKNIVEEAQCGPNAGWVAVENIESESISSSPAISK